MSDAITPDLPERMELLALLESKSEKTHMSFETSSTEANPLNRKRFGYNAPHVVGVVPFHHMSDTKVRATLMLLKGWLQGNCTVVQSSSS